MATVEGVTEDRSVNDVAVIESDNDIFVDDDEFPAEFAFDILVGEYDDAVPEAKVVDLIDCVVEAAAVTGCGVGIDCVVEAAAVTGCGVGLDCVVEAAAVTGCGVGLDCVVEAAAVTGCGVGRLKNL